MKPLVELLKLMARIYILDSVFQNSHIFQGTLIMEDICLYLVPCVRGMEGGDAGARSPTEARGRERSEPRNHPPVPPQRIGEGRARPKNFHSELLLNT